MELNIHKDIKKKLDYFIHTRKIPHIIFHGETGTGKRTILQEFIRNIYDNDKELINLYVIYIDCGHGKGIKFIRDELKFFARANIHNSQKLFKSIVLLNSIFCFLRFRLIGDQLVMTRRGLIALTL